VAWSYAAARARQRYWREEYPGQIREWIEAEGIAAERRSGAALILRWLDERSAYLEALSQEVKLIARFSRTSPLPFKRRVRYLGLRCASEIGKRMPRRRQLEI